MVVCRQNYDPWTMFLMLYMLDMLYMLYMLDMIPFTWNIIIFTPSYNTIIWL